MDATTPSANFQPHKVQYTPADRSIENSVLALVRPSASSLTLVRTKTRANLNFATSAPIVPSPAAPLPQRARCFGEGCRSTARLNSPTRAATVRDCLLSLRTSARAWRHASSTALG